MCWLSVWVPGLLPDDTVAIVGERIRQLDARIAELEELRDAERAKLERLRGCYGLVVLPLGTRLLPHAVAENEWSTPNVCETDLSSRT